MTPSDLVSLIIILACVIVCGGAAMLCHVIDIVRERMADRAAAERGPDWDID